MGSSAGITLSATVSGLPEGGLEQISIGFSNTSAAFQAQIAEVATALAVPTAISIPSSAQFFLAMAYSTNQWNWRVTPSSVENGFQLTSNGVFFARTAGGQTYRIYTTQGTTFQVRVWTF